MKEYNVGRWNFFCIPPESGSHKPADGNAGPYTNGVREARENSDRNWH